MGIFRDLVANYANSKIKEQQNQLAYNQSLGDILTTLIQNPDTDPATYAKASSLYQDLLGKHGGKEGKALQGQIGTFLAAYGQQRGMKKALEQSPFESPDEPVAGTLGVKASDVVQPRATPASLTQQPAPAARGGGGFGGKLRSLAGVGGEMLGVPRGGQQNLPTKEQIERVYGPTAVDVAKEKERGEVAAHQIDRAEYVRQQQADEAAGIQTADDTRENIREFDRAMKPPAARTAAEEAQTLTTVELKSGEIIQAWESKRGQGFKTLDGKPINPSDIRSVGTPIDPKLSGALKERVEIQNILKDPKSPPEVRKAAEAQQKFLDTQLESAQSLATIRRRQTDAASSIVPGTDEFVAAQNLAYGNTTWQQFNSLISYRDSDRRLAVFAKAQQLNPNFSPSMFQAGYGFFARPQTRQQLASLDNVQAAMDDMIRFSDDAKRAGNPLMNQFVLPGGYLMGNRPIANFQLALVAFSDELAGALGQGANTDMTRRMGREMSDGNVDPDTFQSNLQIVQGFLSRKRDSLLGEMGPYGQPGAQVPVMNSRPQYDALPPGSQWRKPSDPPGTSRTKPPDPNWKPPAQPPPQ